MALPIDPELEQGSHHIARELVRWSEGIVDPVLHALCEDYGPGFRGIEYRVGNGKQTCHRNRANKERGQITYGALMVADHIRGTHQEWTHTREIRRYGFMGGDTAAASALVHVVVHEIGHALQFHRGGREYGSVHNRQFYQAVRDLYANLSNDHLAKGIERFEQELANVKAMLSPEQLKKPRRTRRNSVTTDGRASAFRQGQRVMFQARRGKVVTARVERVNPKTCTVYCLESGQGYRVPYPLLEATG